MKTRAKRLTNEEKEASADSGDPKSKYVRCSDTNCNAVLYRKTARAHLEKHGIVDEALKVKTAATTLKRKAKDVEKSRFLCSGEVGCPTPAEYVCLTCPQTFGMRPTFCPFHHTPHAISMHEGVLKCCVPLDERRVVELEEALAKQVV
jgi:hypothetical protein